MNELVLHKFLLPRPSPPPALQSGKEVKRKLVPQWCCVGAGVKCRKIGFINFVVRGYWLLILLFSTGRDSVVLVKLLRKEYKRRSQLRPLLWDSTIQLPIEQVYTRLILVSRGKVVIQMGDEEDNDKVNVFDFFKVPDIGEDVMTIIEGSPGIGKRTSQHKVKEQVYTRPTEFFSRGKLAIQMEDDEEESDDDEESDDEESDDEESDDVNVFDIFKVPDIGEDVMTIVEGSPGIGKTTFCLKLAYDWAHGNIPSECSFPKFEFVFLLKCRDIDGDIMEAISEQLLPRDMDMEKSVEKLLHFMKDIHKQERLMLIILDGLDELPEQSRHHVDELLHRRILPFCFVLATTRQERGIEVRKSVVFHIHLEIKGYTESDSIAYVRRHFETIGQSPKGERLIEEMQQNTFLHALRSNPLNLLLLCVVYEDQKGKLPTSRTELYQVIVRCLLRRHCAKRNWPAPKDDTVLEKRFKKEILALGELAWLCLLSRRYGFFETELDEFERRYPGLVARELGLLYKEESLKRLKPQHEYCFLHKTFQEYLAAAYIAEKLVNQQFNVFDHFPFDDLVTKYPQVFIFVSGMLGEKATVLFTQIGEELKTDDWDWNEHCSKEEATFFIESFNESGHPEQMAATLCQIIPFPKSITLETDKDYNASFVDVLIACNSFSNVQTPVELYANTYILEGRGSKVLSYIESSPQLAIVSFTLDSRSFTSSVADRLCKWSSATKSLSEFNLKFRYYPTPDECDLLVQICHGLASCPTLTKVKFFLPSEGFFKALVPRLIPLTSVGLGLRGFMSGYTATRVLQNFLSNKSLRSLSLCIVGADVQDLLVAAVSEALARHKVLKYLDIYFGGPLSSSSANFLEKGLMENSSLNDLRLCVNGELPNNWHSVVENLRLAKTSSVVCSIHPNSWNNVADNLCRPVVVREGLNLKQHFTVNVWGEMSCEAAKALCEALAVSSITFLTLNVRGNLTSGVANSIARCLEGNQTLSVLSINIWGELTTEGGIVLSRLSKENLSVQLNEHDVRIGPDESNTVLDITMDNPAALRAFFTKVKERRKEKVSLTINNNGYVTKEWTRCLGDALAENTSLTSLDLTLNRFLVDADLGENLGESLLQSTSLTSVSLIFNCSYMKEGWLFNLSVSLDKMASLTTLSLGVNFYGGGREGSLPTNLMNVLVPIKSLSTLSVVIHIERPLWIGNVGHFLIKCTSLKKLSLTFNSEFEPYHAFDGLDEGLAKTTSLDTLSLAIYSNCYDADAFSILLALLNRGFSLNSSVNTLTVTVTVSEFVVFEFPSMFQEGLSLNMSVTTLSLIINEYGEGKSHIPLVLHHSGVFQYLVQNTSVTTFNLTLNSSKEVDSDDWVRGLCEALKENTSLTTLRLKVNNHCSTGKSRLYDFSKLLIESQTLALLELEVSFYGNDSGWQKLSIQ